jgi:hypothetical protein
MRSTVNRIGESNIRPVVSTLIRLCQRSSAVSEEGIKSMREYGYRDAEYESEEMQEPQNEPMSSMDSIL